MRQAWLEQQERGNAVFINFCAEIGRRLSWRAGRAFVYPICAYFTATSQTARSASRDYLSLILGRRATVLDVFRHYLTFSCTIHDRIFFLSGRFENYDFDIHGHELFKELVDRDQGCLLLGSHLGSFEALRSIGIIQRKLPIKVLMYPENSPHMSAAQNRLNPDVADSIIPIGAPESMLRVKEYIEKGGMVGILGDRSVEGEKTVPISFLGRPALFPAGPMLLASALKAPVIMFFGLYRGGRRYELHFELLSEQLSIDRRTRDADLETWTSRFAARLEYYCRMAPYNWFNFFDFWRSGRDAP